MKESVRSVVDLPQKLKEGSNVMERWTEAELCNGTEGIGGPAAKRMTISPLRAGWTFI